MNPVQKLIAAGNAAAQTMFGAPASLARDGAEYWQGSLVWVETGGDASVEIGGRVLSIDGRATIAAADILQAPKPGDRLAVNGKIFLITGVWKSSFDAAYNLSATLLT